MSPETIEKLMGFYMEVLILGVISVLDFCIIILAVPIALILNLGCIYAMGLWRGPTTSSCIATLPHHSLALLNRNLALTKMTSSTGAAKAQITPSSTDSQQLEVQIYKVIILVASISVPCRISLQIAISIHLVLNANRYCNYWDRKTCKKKNLSNFCGPTYIQT